MVCGTHLFVYFTNVFAQVTNTNTRNITVKIVLIKFQAEGPPVQLEPVDLSVRSTTGKDFNFISKLLYARHFI